VKVFLICINIACGRIGPGNIGSPKDRRHIEDMRQQRPERYFLGTRWDRPANGETRISNTVFRWE